MWGGDSYRGTEGHLAGSSGQAETSGTGSQRAWPRVAESPGGELHDTIT